MEDVTDGLGKSCGQHHAVEQIVDEDRCEDPLAAVGQDQCAGLGHFHGLAEPDA
ncbi:hypothetical protein D3C76_1209540 [compost metagenome]